MIEIVVFIVMLLFVSFFVFAAMSYYFKQSMKSRITYGPVSGPHAPFAYRFQICCLCGSRWHEEHYNDRLCHSCQEKQYPGESVIKKWERYTNEAKASGATIVILCAIALLSIKTPAAPIALVLALYLFLHKIVIDGFRYRHPGINKYDFENKFGVYKEPTN